MDKFALVLAVVAVAFPDDHLVELDVRDRGRRGFRQLRQLLQHEHLERLLRAVAGGRDIPERFTGWRQAVITDDLLALIR